LYHPSRRGQAASARRTVPATTPTPATWEDDTFFRTADSGKGLRKGYHWNGWGIEHKRDVPAGSRRDRGGSWSHPAPDL
jgi:hypothetical protein